MVPTLEEPPATAERRRFRIPVIWRRAGLAIATLLVCEVGARIVLPGLNGQALRDFLQTGSSTWLLRLYDWFLGGALSRGTALGIGIMPYLSARIYLRLARVISPRIAVLRDTDRGRDTLTRWTRWLTGGLALVQSYGFARFAEQIPDVVAHPGAAFLAKTMAVLTSGALGVMFLSERLTKPADDDSPVAHDAPSSSETKLDRSREVARLEQSMSAERLLSAGEAPLEELLRPKRDRVRVPRDAEEAR
jgi:preprotein translocase subunit SecY